MDPSGYPGGGVRRSLTTAEKKKHCRRKKKKTQRHGGDLPLSVPGPRTAGKYGKK